LPLQVRSQRSYHLCIHSTRELNSAAIFTKKKELIFFFFTTAAATVRKTKGKWVIRVYERGVGI
jgi:hypothetical protein